MKKTTILVIDDEMSIREYISVHLIDAGYNVISVGCVVDAIKAVMSNSSISLIICDIMMPEQDGFEFMRYLGSNLRFSSIPLIFSTNLADEMTVIRAKALGARAYITKPFTRQRLLDKVTDTLESGKGTVVIVSCDQLGRNIIARALFVSRFNPLTAANAEEAKSILSEKSVDIIISDIVLDDCSGLEFLVYVKENYQRMPVIFVAGKKNNVCDEQLISSGADGVIRKPFVNTDIVAKIEFVMMIRRNTALREISIINKIRKRARNNSTTRK